MDQIILNLWLILLLVTVLVLPYLVYLLHSTWRSARSIERYFLEMKEAGMGIASNTAHISALDTTIDSASEILAVAGDIDSHADTLKITLAKRADNLDKTK